MLNARVLVPAALLLAALPLHARAAGDPPAEAARRLTLADAVALASGQAPAVDLATMREREAAGKVWQSRAAFLPSLGASASATNRTFNLEAQGIKFPTLPGVPPLEEPVGPVDNVDARVRVTQTVFDFSSMAKISAANHGLAQSRAERGASVEGAAQSAALAYLRAARASAVVSARAADQTLSELLLTLAQAQLAAGTSPQIDVTRARTQVATVRGQQLVARNPLDRAEIDLARALGLDPATRFEIADTLSDDLAGSIAPSDEAAALAVARERRPELLVERARLAKASADKRAISAERLPRIEAAADYGLSGEHGDDAIATRQYGVALSLPLFDGLRREGRLTEQGAIQREAEIRTRDLDQQVTADVNAALLDLASGLEQRSVARERLALAQEELDQSRERFVSGVAGSLELINSQVTLNDARDAEIDARFAVAAARIALARAAGVAATLR